MNVARGASHIPDSFIEHTLQVALCEGRTFEVLVRTDLLGHGQGLLIRYGFHLSCAEAICGRSIVPQVQLGTDENDGDVGGMMFDFRIPLRTHHRSVTARIACSLGPPQPASWDERKESKYLGLDVIKGRRANDGETDEENIGLGVGQRSESVVILLASSIPQT